MHTGRSSQTARTASTRTACCGTSPNVVALSAADASTPVELVRCTSCGVSAWHVDGLSVGRERALEVLAQSFANGTAGTTARRPAQPRPTTPRRAAAPRTAAPATGRPATVQLTAAEPAPAELADLLAGWQVFGTTS